MRFIILIFIPILFFSYPLLGQDSTDVLFELFQEDNHIVFQFYNNEIFDDDVREHIEKGVIVGVEHHIKLWENHSIFDNIIVEKVIRVKIQYDHWSESFLIQTSKGDSCTLNELDPKSSCLFLTMALVDTQNLEDHTSYFASVESILHPISLDNFKEINQWFQSEVTGIDPKKIKNMNRIGRSISGWFLKMLMNVSGFGDKISNTRSSIFKWENNQINWIKED